MAAHFTKILSCHILLCNNFDDFEFNGENRLKIRQEMTKIFVILRKKKKKKCGQVEM